MKLVNTGSERHDSDLETGAGDITVYVAADVAINVRASVDMGNGHRIMSEFPDIHVHSEGDPVGPKTLTADGALERRRTNAEGSHFDRRYLYQAVPSKKVVSG